MMMMIMMGPMQTSESVRALQAALEGLWLSPSFQHFPTSLLSMKALSPVRGCYEAVCCLSERSLAIARGRGKSPAAEEPLSLLDDMNHCYSRLRELVPGVPRGTQLSQVEILQRVIDYILDLQVVLAEPAPGPPDGPHLPIQTAELAPELVISNDQRSFCH
ncbi:DNA-binding protein inhibitor ID-3 [Dama dama]|uniref:DNA-binding protein inhibitor ID-3 n=1 Tax=Dama dama TaxID=30532 RepID=UPI002A36D27F|nr:DNA-binding protein inhibitor ID-3 [Dama dama]